MSKKWTLLALILSFGSTGVLQAEPLDSPDIVYIDGKPCNRACQSYMDWSYRASSAGRRDFRETRVAVPAEAEADRVEPVARPRVTRHAAPLTRTVPYAGKAASNGRAAGLKASDSKKIAASDAAPPTPRKAITAVATAVTLPPPATLEIAARPAASALATTSKASETGQTASASPDDLDNLVALVLAGPEINSLSDLNNKNIAITQKQSASSGRVSAALMAAGAAEVRFSEVKASAIDRLIDGEVPAAVVLAPREVANLFPELAGFRTFRVPLKARL
jgi:hypothetical protein